MSSSRSEAQQSTRIPFTKASACGNDFLMVEGERASGDLGALSRRLCDRHRGVGADGVEWLFPDAEADVKARLINADGSEAEISGNGTRCVAAEICSRENKTEVVVRTGAGLKTCRLIGREDGREGRRQGSKRIWGSQRSAASCRLRRCGCGWWGREFRWGIRTS
jgi:hypothetical protein